MAASRVKRKPVATARTLERNSAPDTPVNTIFGNSGALVTDRHDVKKLHGVFDGSYEIEASWKNTYFRLAYRGSLGAFKEITESKKQILFDYGTSFDYLKSALPELW